MIEMQVDKFKVLCRTGEHYWHCMDAVFDTLEQALTKSKTYDAWDTAIVQIKVMQKKSLDYIDEEEACQD